MTDDPMPSHTRPAARGAPAAAHERLRRWWEATGAIRELRPAREAELAALERRYAIAAPGDFRDYLAAACPADDLWDAEDAIWWSLRRIRSIPEEYEYPVRNPVVVAEAHRYLFFADFAIWCWAWAIACTDDENRGRVALIGGEPDRFVADSFTEFVQLYLANPRLVY